MRRIPTWIQLRALGNSRLIKSSYIWLVFVPFAANALAPLADIFVFDIFGQDISINISLPFRWKIFYYMAVMFGVGEVIYLGLCPALVRAYDNFTQYRSQHSGGYDLTVHVLTAFRKTEVRRTEHALRAIAQSAIGARVLRVREAGEEFRTSVESGNFPSGDHLHQLLSVVCADDDVVGDVFDATRRVAAVGNPGARLLCTVFMAFGLVLFIILLIDSFKSVVQMS